MCHVLRAYRCAQALSTLWLGEGTFARGNFSLDGWRNVFVQTRADNETFVLDTFARLVPEPRGPCLEHLNMDGFYATPKLKVYILEARHCPCPMLELSVQVLMISDSHWHGFLWGQRVSSMKSFNVDRFHTAPAF